jgi:ketosteroid isomerase-like protein
MHPQASVLEKLYTCLNGRDPEGMAACYHEDACFRDIGFTLQGAKQIRSMWQMIADPDTNLRASFTIRHVDDHGGTVDLVDDYTFREKPEDRGRPVHNVIRSEFRFQGGRIIEHRDYCNPLTWGIQALGPVKGVVTWLIPALRRKKAMAKLKDFTSNSKPE